MEPSALFFWTFSLIESQISDVETLRKWVKFDPRTTGGLRKHLEYVVRKPVNSFLDLSVSMKVSEFTCVGMTL